jgi:hypothetical protein
MIAFVPYRSETDLEQVTGPAGAGIDEVGVAAMRLVERPGERPGRGRHHNVAWRKNMLRQSG